MSEFGKDFEAGIFLKRLGKGRRGRRSKLFSVRFMTLKILSFRNFAKGIFDREITRWVGFAGF